MSKTIEKAEQVRLPALLLRGIVAFPAIPISFELSDEKQIAVCEKAEKDDSPIVLVFPMEREGEELRILPVGTVAVIKQLVRLPEGNARLFVEGTCRAAILDKPDFSESCPEADVVCKTVSLEANGGVKGEAFVLELRDRFREFCRLLPKISNELVVAVMSIPHPGMLADLIACNVLVNYEDKLVVLSEFDPLSRARLLAVLMERERMVLEEEVKIHRQVREQLDQNQKEYYLREQLKVIRNELGEVDDADGELDEYRDKIKAAKLPQEIEEKLLKEVGKLAKTPYASAESSVLRSYLDICLEIPWTKKSADRCNIEAAKKILERDHNGLDKVKERILEYIAVRQRNPELNNQILCLVGPPGTGKTSVAASIADAMKRKYVRVSLGGIRDEADIRGHRKTYVAAMPGRIVNALIRAGTRNPLILLDEIDKMTQDAHGDPASAMLEVLDGEQNKSFRDHFVELPIDLSDCIFIATANSLEGIPRPLIDRMEIIELKTYTRHEKLAIAKDHLLPKQRKRHGLSAKDFRMTDGAILEIIDFYTQEAGVRNLERELAAVCRKAAMQLTEHPELTHVRVKEDDIASYLGCRKVLPEHIYDSDEVGVVNGLAYTSVGGDLLRIEAAAMPGSGKLELTGSLGDVMKESAHLAISYIREHAEELGVTPDFYKTKDIHIHVPEGAVPKDGPSAGVTLVTALASELSGKPVRRDLAMTGEITLRGRVLAIGGLREKTMAAYKAGVSTVCIPADNERDLAEIDPIVREKLHFVPCRRVDDVLASALL